MTIVISVKDVERYLTPVGIVEIGTERRVASTVTPLKMKTCILCDAPITRGTPKKYCPSCSIKKMKEHEKNYKKKSENH